MRASYRIHPILKTIQEGAKNYDEITFFTNDVQPLLSRFSRTQSVLEILDAHRFHFNRKVQILSDSFERECTTASQKMLTKELVEDFQADSGTIIMGPETYCYLFRENKSFLIIGFWKNRLTFYLDSCDASKEFHSIDSYKMDFGDTYNKVNISKYVVSMVIATLNFIRYAPVTTKSLPPKKVSRDLNCKYTNDTSITIQYLTSTWFTNLVKSDSFKVRGHFRLQPKKVDGIWTKELIWIAEYLKDGYMLPARIQLRNK